MRDWRSLARLDLLLVRPRFAKSDRVRTGACTTTVRADANHVKTHRLSFGRVGSRHGHCRAQARTDPMVRALGSCSRIARAHRSLGTCSSRRYRSRRTPRSTERLGRYRCNVRSACRRTMGIRLWRVRVLRAYDEHTIYFTVCQPKRVIDEQPRIV